MPCRKSSYTLPKTTLGSGWEVKEFSNLKFGILYIKLTMDPNLKNENLKKVCSRLPFIVMGIQSESVKTSGGNRDTVNISGTCVAESSHRQSIPVTPTHYHSAYKRSPTCGNTQTPDVIIHNNNYYNNSGRLSSKNRAKLVPSSKTANQNSVILPHPNHSGENDYIICCNSNQKGKFQSSSENQFQLQKTLASSPNNNTCSQHDLNEKMEAILVQMQEKDDQISILCTEVTRLKEVLYKSTAENGSSKHLYQNLRSDLGKMEKQLYNIEEKMEQQELSCSLDCCYPRSRGVSSSSSCCSDFLFDYDRLIEGIKMLNVRAETGHSLGVCFNSGGARFKNCDGIILTLFKNGLLLDNRDFMPLTGSRAKIFSQDIFDGYFPNEFQRQFPSGVIFVTRDKRTVTFNSDAKYSGDGYILKNYTNVLTDELPCLVPGEHLSRLKTRQFCLEFPSFKLSSGNNSIPSISTSSSTYSIHTSKYNIIDLPILTASYGILLSKKNAGLDDKIIRMKLKNIKTGKCYQLKTSIYVTVGEVIHHLCCNVKEQQEGERIELIHSSPIGILSCSQVVLKDYGIDSNILLYFRNVISQLT